MALTFMTCVHILGCLLGAFIHFLYSLNNMETYEYIQENLGRICFNELNLPKIVNNSQLSKILLQEIKYRSVEFTIHKIKCGRSETLIIFNLVTLPRERICVDAVQEAERLVCW